MPSEEQRSEHDRAFGADPAFNPAIPPDPYTRRMEDPQQQSTSNRVDWTVTVSACIATACLTILAADRLMPKRDRYEIATIDKIAAVVRLDRKTGEAEISIAGQAWKPIAYGYDAFAAQLATEK